MTKQRRRSLDPLVWMQWIFCSKMAHVQVLVRISDGKLAKQATCNHTVHYHEMRV